MVDVSIILINFNTLSFTLQCIESIYQHSSGFAFEIIIIDNASTGFSNNDITDKFSNVIVKVNDQNLGFAKANNQGIRLAKGEFILLLNNDAQLIENSIKHCLDILQKNSKIGVVSPKLIYPDEKLQHSVHAFPSITNELLDLFRITKFLSQKKLAKRYLGRYHNYEQSGVVPWVWATFFLFPKKILQQLPSGQLYEEFFMYYEDVYWSFQFRSLGLDIYYTADTSIVHYLSQSLGTTSIQKYDLIMENEWIFLKMYKGSMYTFFFFIIKAFVHYSQRSAHLRKLGSKYLRKAFK
jgi:GT2 family glycosyltransferase